MHSFWRIFSLELKAFIRSKALAILLVVSVAWMFAMPHFVTGDGTIEGARELYIHYSLGGVFAFLVLSLLASATGSIAREREAKRLQLSLVRPVSRLVLVLGKALALLSVGAVVLAIASLILAARTDLTRTSNHVLSPLLPSPREEAKTMYEAFMASPETPVAVKRTKKEIVLRLLERRAVDRYETIPTNGVARWRFDFSGLGLASLDALPDAPAARFRFSGAFNRREMAIGSLRLSDYAGSVSNLTQSVLTVPLRHSSALTNSCSASSALVFTNNGAAALQFRPRRDIQLLIPADSFGRNLLRAYIELVACLAFLIAFGLFLSASLTRPVAVFIAFIVLLISEMSPSVIESYPDELETKLTDRIGLVFTRAAVEVTRPVSALNPLEKLATDDCIEWAEVIRIFSLNALFAPFFFCLVAAFLLPRKSDNLG